MTTLSEHLARIGRKGGKARAEKLSKEEMSESNRKAAEARWQKQREHLEKTVATITEGTKRLEKVATRPRQSKESK